LLASFFIADQICCGKNLSR